MELHSFPAPGLDKRSDLIGFQRLRSRWNHLGEEGPASREVTLTASEADIIEDQGQGRENVVHATHSHRELSGAGPASAEAGVMARGM